MLADPRQRMQRPLDPPRALAQRLGGRLGDQPLRLRERRGDRRAQLVRAVRGEAALGRERAIEPRHQLGDRIGDGRDLGRQPPLVERRQIVAAARGDRAAEAPDRREAGAHDQPDPEQADRQEQRERPDHREGRLHLRAPARRERLRDQQRDRALQHRLRVDPMRRGAGEARLQVLREKPRVCVVRAQQQLARLVAHDVRQQLVVRANRRDAPAAAIAVVAVRIAPDDIHHGERQQPLRGFLQRAVGHLLDLGAQHVERGRAARRRQRDEPRHERRREPPLQAAQHR